MISKLFYILCLNMVWISWLIYKKNPQSSNILSFFSEWLRERGVGEKAIKCDTGQRTHQKMSFLSDILFEWHDPYKEYSIRIQSWLHLLWKEVGILKKTKGKNATKKLTWNRKCLTAKDLKENNSMTLPFSNQNLSLYKKDDISMTRKLFQLTELILRVRKDTYTGFHSMQGWTATGRHEVTRKIWKVCRKTV